MPAHSRPSVHAKRSWQAEDLQRKSSGETKQRANFRDCLALQLASDLRVAGCGALALRDIPEQNFESKRSLVESGFRDPVPAPSGARRFFFVRFAVELLARARCRSEPIPQPQ